MDETESKPRGPTIKIDPEWGIYFDRDQFTLMERSIVTHSGRLGARVELPIEERREKWTPVCYAMRLSHILDSYVVR